MGWFSDWRRSRTLRRHALDARLWAAAVGRYSFTRALSGTELQRLRDLATLFLHEKAIHGAGGLEVNDGIRMAVAAQACILILNLDLDYFRGWTEVIVYPDEFVVDYEYADEDGVVHRVQEPMAGESWLRGPVILSWADATAADRGTGYNVVIHEFAHKIDMLNGDANGFPPLHAGMSREAWSGAFAPAYADFCARAERGERTPFDAYAAEDPAEFFAVASEAFFELPQALQPVYPEVYRQLALFYRQDPLGRMQAAAAGGDRAGAGGWVP